MRNQKTENWAGYNSSIPIDGVSCSADNIVVAEIFVIFKKVNHDFSQNSCNF